MLEFEVNARPSVAGGTIYDVQIQEHVLYSTRDREEAESLVRDLNAALRNTRYQREQTSFCPLA